MPGIAVDDRGTALLVGADYFSEFFGIELRVESSGADQITEHHGELAAFGFGDSKARLFGCERSRRLPRFLCAGRAVALAALGWGRLRSSAQRSATVPTELGR